MERSTSVSMMASMMSRIPSAWPRVRVAAWPKSYITNRGRTAASIVDDASPPKGAFRPPSDSTGTISMPMFPGCGSVEKKRCEQNWRRYARARSSASRMRSSRDRFAASISSASVTLKDGMYSWTSNRSFERSVYMYGVRSQAEASGRGASFRASAVVVVPSSSSEEEEEEPRPRTTTTTTTTTTSGGGRCESPTGCGRPGGPIRRRPTP
mmetsp:Transcript_1476/g.3715  ORF Transcript_1476/g.3715 Transcript_1476/m.3715 type:complete len:210 (-) Transcript_1476:123-752(-)